MISRTLNKIKSLYLHYVVRDKSTLEFSRWFKDKGDETLRLSYPLKRNSIVFDIGGYQGDFAAAIYEQYGCKIYIFEPVPEFYQQCVDRFSGIDQIVCLNYGLSSNNGWFDINLDENSSSLTLYKSDSQLVSVQIRSIVECIRELEVERIDLVKINIEGGEFDLIPALMESEYISSVNYLQVQFDSFVPDAKVQRLDIRRKLLNTHSEMWNYEFVWESWKLKDKVN